MRRRSPELPGLAPLAAGLLWLAACSPSGTAAPPCPASADDGDPCTVDACDPATGIVTHAPAADDGNPCTIDACDPLTGVVTHVPAEVDDGIACTVDRCDPATGAISHVPSFALCAAGEVCSPAAGCEAAPACAALARAAGTAAHFQAVVSAGLSAPVHVTSPPGETARLFVVEQAGRIRLVKDGVLLAAPYLDLHALVSCCGERGLLSLAFHPAFAENGKLYVNYTDLAGDVRISEFTAPSPAGDSADPGSEVILATIPHHAYANHNGGLLAFGPDGFLYASVGDGGGGGDPLGSGQSTTALLGKLLRLDPADPGAPAPGNPFGNAVYDYGLRNAWRYAFDRRTGDLYIGDVGQGAREEIDFKAAPAAGEAPPPGTNWGWNVMEGTACYSPPSGCDTAGLALPVLDYDHTVGQAVTGGNVYRGVAMPDLAAEGRYFYGDSQSGIMRSFRVVDGAVTDALLLPPFTGVVSFGEDGCGELYAVGYGGTIARLQHD
ncbi:MAG TPA: PQQ-dependent sugar dehydrogenase [Anaeromyxobacteraceae bacterium]|nr:PQQ-dependent sugar dehydrogenase [Anaeromyxobacteraceae bacterium]